MSTFLLLTHLSKYKRHKFYCSMFSFYFRIYQLKLNSCTLHYCWVTNIMEGNCVICRVPLSWLISPRHGFILYICTVYTHYFQRVRWDRKWERKRLTKRKPFAGFSVIYSFKQFFCHVFNMTTHFTICVNSETYKRALLYNMFN